MAKCFLWYFVVYLLVLIQKDYVVGDGSKKCSLPEHAVKVQRKNQKAWDKCIDLADNIWECPNTGSNEAVHKCQFGIGKYPSVARSIDETEFPHIGTLGYPNGTHIKWNCGSTLISEEWVMTVAHCIFYRVTGTEVKYVRFGGGKLDTPPIPELFFEVKEIVKHPEYRPRFIYNDIALLKLNRRVVYSSQIYPACLHTGNEISDERAISVGYGFSKANRRNDELQYMVTLDKFDFDDCKKKYPPTRNSPDGLKNEHNICYNAKVNTSDNCQGESGTPLQIYNDDVFCTYQVIGIAAFGRLCTNDYPSIYTKVSGFIPWIESVVWP